MLAGGFEIEIWTPPENENLMPQRHLNVWRRLPKKQNADTFAKSNQKSNFKCEFLVFQPPPEYNFRPPQKCKFEAPVKIKCMCVVSKKTKPQGGELVFLLPPKALCWVSRWVARWETAKVAG